MKVMKVVLAAVIVINIFLLVLQLSSRSSSFPSRAYAQVVAQTGKYLAATSGGRNVLWLIDQSSQTMVVYEYDDRNDRLDRIGPVNLRSDFLRPAGSRTTPR